MGKSEKLRLAKLAGDFEDEVHSAISYGLITVVCPFCGYPREIEPDGNYDDVTCENCGKHYRTQGIC